MKIISDYLPKLLTFISLFCFSQNWAMDLDGYHTQDITQEFFKTAGLEFPGVKVSKDSNAKEYIVKLYAEKCIFFDPTIGKIKVTYPHDEQPKQEINFFYISASHRGKSLGSALLRYALAQSTTGTTLEARPYHFRPGEYRESMLPKLLAFYRNHGGIEIDTDNHIFHFKPII